MTGLLRGELIKIVTTRTVFGYAALGVALIVTNVLIIDSVRGSASRWRTSRRRSPACRCC